MDEVMRRVLAQVETNRAALIDDVAACVRIPSVVGHEGPVQEFMRARYEQLGLEVDVFEADLATVARHPAYVRTPWETAGRPNVVGTRRGTCCAPKVYHSTTSVFSSERLAAVYAGSPAPPGCWLG